MVRRKKQTLLNLRVKIVILPSMVKGEKRQPNQHTQPATPLGLRMAEILVRQWRKHDQEACDTWKSSAPDDPLQRDAHVKKGLQQIEALQKEGLIDRMGLIEEQAMRELAREIITPELLGEIERISRRQIPKTPNEPAKE